MKVLTMYFLFVLSVATSLFAQQANLYESRYGDNGDGTFTNPFLWGDYPDVDMIRVGDDYYMVCSTFCLTPGIPICHSKDLVNWEIIGYAYERLIGDPVYDMKDGKTRYNGGSWAPCIRYHDGKFYIFYYDNLGYFVTCTADKPEGPYRQTMLRYRLYDPGVLFDEDGKVYVAHGQNAIYITEVSSDFTKVVTPQRMVFSSFRGAWEGSHLYKRNGYYYICNTAGGTSGQEYILRSKNIYGPYEVREMVNTDANLSGCGLHQGGFIDLHNGESWFFLFQDRIPAGRTPWLFPIRWVDDWPVLPTWDNYGRIAPTQDKPFHNSIKVEARPFERSDDFNSSKLNLHWQWSHNPDNERWSLTERPGYMRLYAVTADNWENARNTLVKRFIGPEMTATTCLDLTHLQNGDYAGLCVWNKPYSYLGVRKEDGRMRLVWTDNGKENMDGPDFDEKKIYLKVKGDNTGIARFWYSFDNRQWNRLGNDFRMGFSGATYLGNRFGLFCFHVGSGQSGYADFDYMHLNSPYGPANHFKAFDQIPFSFYDDEHNIRLSRRFSHASTPEQTLSFWEKDAWVQFNNVDFGEGAKRMVVTALLPVSSTAILEIREGTVDGELLGTCYLQASGETNDFQKYHASLKTVTGRKKLFFLLKEGDETVKFLTFKFK